MSAFSAATRPKRPGAYVNFDVDPPAELEPRLDRRVLTQVSRTDYRRVEFSGGTLDGERRFIRHDELRGAYSFQPLSPIHYVSDGEAMPTALEEIPPVETYALEKWVDGLGGLFYEAKLA